MKILLVEDDLTFCRILEGFLEKNGHQVTSVHKSADGITQLTKDNYHLLLLDYRLPDGNGIDVLNSARKQGMAMPAIIMTGFNDVRTAVRAMRSGAFDYITKPVNPDELLLVVNESLSKDNSTPDVQPTTGFVKGESPEAKKLYDYISLVAPTEMSVLVQGESGTGKEHVARAIHDQSKRATKPFIALDCGALSGDLAASELFGHAKGAFTGALTDKTGQFELAEGGTIFLDEIGNLSYAVQVKLLRAVQERTIQAVGGTKQINIDVRIIAATNDDLLSSVAGGSFREDLYHRINEFKIEIPALRHRGKDLLLFVDHFRNRANIELERKVNGFSADVMDVFKRYDWPGNLRELKNVIRRMVLLTQASVAEAEALPSEMITAVNQSAAAASGSDIKAMNEANEKTLIISTLAQVKYNKTLAAKLLNIDRKTLYSKLEKYNIE